MALIFSTIMSLQEGRDSIGLARATLVSAWECRLATFAEERNAPRLNYILGSKRSLILASDGLELL